MCVINKNIMKTSANVGDDKLTILHQGRSFTFDVALEVLYFYRAGRLIFVVALDGTEYPLKEKLSTVLEQFASINMVQVNRSVVFNFNFVAGFEVGLKRDTLDLIFKPSIQKIIATKVKTLFTVTREHIPTVKTILGDHK